MTFPLYFAYWPGQSVQHHPFAACGCCLDVMGKLQHPTHPQKPDLMVFHDSIAPTEEHIPTLAASLADAAVDCDGILLDLEHTAQVAAKELAAQLRSQVSPNCKVILPERYSAAEGPTLYTYDPMFETFPQFKKRLEGSSDAWLELAPIHLLTPLPVPQESAQLHDLAELEQIRRTQQLPQFYSDELCCHYFSFLREQTVYLGLYDTPQSLHRRLELAQPHCCAAIGLGFELADLMLDCA